MIKIDLRAERYLPRLLLVGIYNLQGVELAAVVIGYDTWNNESLLKKLVFEAVMLTERGKSEIKY